MIRDSKFKAHALSFRREKAQNCIRSQFGRPSMSFGQPNQLGRKKVEMMNVMEKCAKLLIESKLSQSHKTEKMRTLHPH